MPLLLLRRLSPVIVLLLVAIFFREPATELSLEHQRLLNWMPYITLGIAMLLCINYNRARLFTLSFFLVIVFYTEIYFRYLLFRI